MSSLNPYRAALLACGLLLLALPIAYAQSITGVTAGKVTDAKNKAIPGALVIMENEKLPLRSAKGKATTEADGYFTIPGLRPGPYLLSVEKEGYKPFRKQPVIIDAMGRISASPVKIETRAGSVQGQIAAAAQLHIMLASVEAGAINDSTARLADLQQLGSFALRTDFAGATGLHARTTPGQNAPTTLPQASATPAPQIAGKVPDAGRLQLQPLSGERSELVNNNQVKNLQLKGRDILDFLRLVPGVVISKDATAEGVLSDPGRFTQFSINGTRKNQHEIVVDGMSNLDTRDNGAQHVTFNPDAVAEIKILTANYQAEYGKSAGGLIQIVTKSGTTEFHGGLRYYHRHEGLNANGFFNNAAGRFGDDDGIKPGDKCFGAGPCFGQERLPRPINRYRSFGYELGGPVYVPHFSKGVKRLDNLFFYVNQEFYRQRVPNVPRTLRVPTVEEREGKFGSTIIPKNQFFQGGRLLNLFPLPNRVPTDDNWQRNYVSQTSSTYPRGETIARVDYKLSEATDAAARFARNTDNQELPFGLQSTLNAENVARIESTALNSRNFESGNLGFPRPGLNFALTVSHTFSPTLTGELIVGVSQNRLQIKPDPSRGTQAANGLNFPVLFPNSNPQRFLPNLDFGFIGRLAPNIGDFVTTRRPESRYSGLPFKSFNDTVNLAANLSKVWNHHLLKGGASLQENRREQSALVDNLGTVSFITAGDDQQGFARMLLGNFVSYSQTSAAPVGRFRYRNVEGYAQDLWRVNDRLVLDFGLRFSRYQPEYDARLQTSFFDPQRFDPTKPVKSNGVFNGFALAGQGYPRSGLDGRGAQLGPRFGFAYDVFGTGSTILRGGFGIFYDRVQGGIAAEMLRNPPAVTTSFVASGALDKVDPTAATEISAGRFPVFGIARDSKIPTVYSYSLNLQRDIGFDTVVDVAYVGTLGRHFAQARDINAQPYGLKPDGTSAFARPFTGYREIRYYEFGGTSNYHALQVSARRRFSRNLTFSVAYTWSKAFTTASEDLERTNAFNVRAFDYRLAAYDRTHVFTASYVYSLPKLSDVLGGFKLLKPLFDGWQISGITQFSSGQPYELLNLSGGTGGALTGSSTELARVFVHYDQLRTDPDDGLQVDPRAFYLQAPLPPGETHPTPWPRMYLRGPGINNFDLAIYKNFPLGGDVRYLQLRLELFNAFNHTQFSSVNVRGFADNANFIAFPTRRGTYCNFQGKESFVIQGTNCNNPNGPKVDLSKRPLGTLFGDYSSAREPRILQVAAKLFF